MLDDFFMTLEDFRQTIDPRMERDFLLRHPSLSQLGLDITITIVLIKIYFSWSWNTPSRAGMPGVLCSAKVVENLMINKKIFINPYNECKHA